MKFLSFPGGSDGKEPGSTWETWVRSLGWEDPLEEGTASHSSVLPWRILWTEKPGRLQSMGSQRVGHDWVTLASRLGGVWDIVILFVPIISSFWVSAPAFAGVLWLHVESLKRQRCPRSQSAGSSLTPLCWTWILLSSSIAFGFFAALSSLLSEFSLSSSIFANCHLSLSFREKEATQLHALLSVCGFKNTCLVTSYWQISKRGYACHWLWHTSAIYTVTCGLEIWQWVFTLGSNSQLMNCGNWKSNHVVEGLGYLTSELW